MTLSLGSRRNRHASQTNTRATNENGSVYIGYDNRYRVSSFSDPFYYGISYNYDTVGNRTRLKVNGATYATYTYDSVNRLTKLADSANLNFNYNYDAANRLTGRTAPNGVTSSYTYDDLDRLTSLMHTAGANTLSGNLYAYNNASNIASWTTQTSQKAYTYDAVDRLTAVSNFESPAENHSYDAVGNRAASHLSASYGYQPFNRLTSTADATYTYDNNGSLISKANAEGTTTYTFNEENQLTQVTLPSGLTVNYKYDGLGRRIQRITSAGADERYIYDGNDALIVLNIDWSVAATYLNDLGVDNHLRQTSATTGVCYFLNDHLGSTAALADMNGNLLEQTLYDSFGNSSGSSRTRYGYTGREYDPDTRLSYYRARFYDSTNGRFISEDPIGFNAGINQFIYTKNRPDRDPFGLHNEDVHYYLTYFIATQFSCLSKDEARLIADADQSTDENPDTAPWPGFTVTQALSNADNHAFTQWATSRLNELRRNALSSNHNYVGMGRYLHFLQDTYSHKGYQNMVIGQFGFNGVDVPFFGGFFVDNTNHDLVKSEEMARNTFFAIFQFARNKDCNCKFADIRSWWPQVMDFLKADNGDLETKRRILNVPRR